MSESSVASSMNIGRAGIGQPDSCVSDVKFGIVSSQEDVSQDPQAVRCLQTHEPRNALSDWSLSDFQHVIFPGQLPLLASEFKLNGGQLGDLAAFDNGFSGCGTDRLVDCLDLVLWARNQAGSSVQNGFISAFARQRGIPANGYAAKVDVELQLSSRAWRDLSKARQKSGRTKNTYEKCLFFVP